MHRRAKRSGAFTLVELLVVIAILLLLLSFLTPMMRRAKDLARRSVCAGNVRALGVALTAYASKHTGRIPLGYQGNSEVKQFNYLLNWSNAHIGRPDMNFGCLYNEKLLPPPKSCYCPTSRHEYFLYDTEINPWLRIVDPTRRNYTRLGYGTRPLAGWDAVTSWVRYGWPVRSSKEVPRMQNLDGRTAILSDIVSTPAYVDTHHGDGVNFARLDGSGQWFDRAGFNRIWQDWTAIHGAYTYLSGRWFPYVPGFFDEGTTPPNGVWFDMDKK